MYVLDVTRNGMDKPTLSATKTLRSRIKLPEVPADVSMRPGSQAYDVQWPFDDQLVVAYRNTVAADSSQPEPLPCYVLDPRRGHEE